MRSWAAGLRLQHSEPSLNQVTENKHGGDTYWDYSLSWYNLVRERVRWWDQEKRRRERERTAEKKRRTLNILQSTICRHFSAFQSPPSGDRLESRNRHFPPAAGLSMCLVLLGAQQPRSGPKLGSGRELLIMGRSYITSHIFSVDPCWVALYTPSEGK